jgi:hypothetical protein
MSRYYTVFWTALGDVEPATTIGYETQQLVGVHKADFKFMADQKESDDYTSILGSLSKLSSDRNPKSKHITVDSILSHGRVDPQSVQPDGKVHQFQVVARIFSAGRYCKTVIVALNGPHLHYYGTKEFMPHLRKTLFGFMSSGEELVTVNGIHYLGTSIPSS